MIVSLQLKNGIRMNTIEITGRYSALANDTCCLSCGGDAEKSEAKFNEVCVDLGSGRGTGVFLKREVSPVFFASYYP